MTSGTWGQAGTEPLIDRPRRPVIGRYDVYAQPGSGGMASVYLALDLAIERKVALKVMSPALANSPDNGERFKREAKVAAALNQPNIIGILAVGDDPELAYFVMKYVEGRSLDSVIRDEGAQPVPLVQAVIASAGKALHYAHTRGVIHRDVKPANFMLDQDGWLVVTDFGIAKQADVKGLTMTGSIIGTPYYMSPEQYHGRPVSPSADQYALGIVAYELLVGSAPYTGDTVAEGMRGHLFDDVPLVRTVRPDVPVELEACIARMMAKEPEQRFATLEEAVIAFGAISPTQEVSVRTQITGLAKIGAAQQPEMRIPLSPVPMQRPTQRATAPGQMDATTPIPTTRPVAAAPKAAPRSRVPAIAALLLLVGAAAGATVWYRGQSGTSSAPETVVPLSAPVAEVAPVDSAAIRDSLERERLAAIAAVATADSIARADSVTRADSIRAAATASTAATAAERRRAAAAAAAAALRARRADPTAPGAGFRVLKDGRRVPSRATPPATTRPPVRRP